MGMYHRIYAHLVWTTRDRERLIDAPAADFLCRVLRAMARKENSYLLKIGMVQTHVHVLARMKPTTPVSALIKRMKGGSSALAGKSGLSCGGFKLYWAKGYAVHSVSPRSLESVRKYLRRQPQHHPTEAIVGWEGDPASEYDVSSTVDASGASPRSANKFAARQCVAWGDAPTQAP